MTREEALKILKYRSGWNLSIRDVNALEMAIKALEQEPQTFEWCHDCSEYNHDKHCCPRYNNVIRNAVEEMKQTCEDAISRKYAIDAVANLFEMSEYPHPYPQGKPIKLKDIKEKLKQLPSVQPKPIECEGAISRQAVLDAIAANCIWENEYNLTSSRIKKAVEGLSPATPQPKTGHWIEYTRVLIPEPINKWEQAWYCSECGYGNQESDESAWLEWKYCPNCGAKMIEPQESEDKE